MYYFLHLLNNEKHHAFVVYRHSVAIYNKAAKKTIINKHVIVFPFSF